MVKGLAVQRLWSHIFPLRLARERSYRRLGGSGSSLRARLLCKHSQSEIKRGVESDRFEGGSVRWVAKGASQLGDICCSLEKALDEPCVEQPVPSPALQRDCLQPGLGDNSSSEVLVPSLDFCGKRV